MQKYDFCTVNDFKSLNNRRKFVRERFAKMLSHFWSDNIYEKFENAAQKPYQYRTGEIDGLPKFYFNINRSIFHDKIHTIIERRVWS